MEKKEKKSGYLNQNFRLFHLRDKKNQEFEFHYHEFHKIIIFLSGNVTYLVEGKAYYLKPWDILLINQHDIHKPIIRSDAVYDRIVLWLKNGFLKEQQDDSCDLSACFAAANEKSFNLIRLPSGLQTKIQSLILALEDAQKSDEFGSSILANTYFLQFMVYVNRVFQTASPEKDPAASSYDKQILAILKYINLHLDEDLSNESLAARFFMSKYYLMHRFKEKTGYTLHSYIRQKRLMCAANLIRQGVPVMKAQAQCGFQDYSTFLRAFRKQFGLSPRQLIRSGRP